ncbi:hypothetical protein Fuma_01666 [Fuerstiella marisgermanici]|uniref:Uncharacterized protein n=1 Tax=Fuerstiella marisgermanici TaxID=1891926 RepID=A0A1P8WDD0_9PLAN|nr:hypothetical protein Fuma_01666 [Fuerstiella marisgermanici]
MYGMGIISLTPFMIYPSAFTPVAKGALLVWTLNASISALYIAVHCDQWRLLSAVSFLDLYFSLCLSAGLVHSLFDESRTTKMKW